MSQGFLIGPGLRDAIKTTINRVAEMPYKERIYSIPTRFEDVQQPAGTSIRVCTFTGSWSINETKTLTFQGVTSTPNTVVATNQLLTVGDACTTQVAYIGKVSSVKPEGATAAWHLLNVQHHETHVITHVAMGETAMTFYRKLAWIPYPGEADPINISGATSTSC
jgi:hypothetical protein